METLSFLVIRKDDEMSERTMSFSALFLLFIFVNSGYRTIRFSSAYLSYYIIFYDKQTRLGFPARIIPQPSKNMVAGSGIA